MTKLEGDASLALATKRKGRWQTGIEVDGSPITVSST